MEDLLSLDDAVMDEVHNIYHPAKRRLPPLLWARLLEDVSDLLMEHAADSVKTLRWAHSQFQEAAKERYLDQRDKAPSYHKALAEYFMGTWAGKPKPYSGSEKGSPRLFYFFPHLRTAETLFFLMSSYHIILLLHKKNFTYPQQKN